MFKCFSDEFCLDKLFDSIRRGFHNMIDNYNMAPGPLVKDYETRYSTILCTVKVKFKHTLV